MADKNYDIKISTEADTKGLKEVEKELDTSKKKFEELGTAGAGAGAKTSEGLKKLFPTFSKLGGALGGLMGSMGSFLNPVTIAITATTAATAAAVKDLALSIINPDRSAGDEVGVQTTGFDFGDWKGMNVTLVVIQPQS